MKSNISKASIDNDYSSLYLGIIEVVNESEGNYLESMRLFVLQSIATIIIQGSATFIDFPLTIAAFHLGVHPAEVRRICYALTSPTFWPPAFVDCLSKIVSVLKSYVQVFKFQPAIAEGSIAVALHDGSLGYKVTTLERIVDVLGRTADSDHSTSKKLTCFCAGVVTLVVLCYYYFFL
jgi:hypothetical protein